MTCVQDLKEIECLAASDFTDDDPVGPMAKRSPEQVTDCDHRRVPLFTPSFEANKIAPMDNNFGGLLNDNDSFLVGNEVRQNVQQGGFAGSGAAADQDVLS